MDPRGLIAVGNNNHLREVDRARFHGSNFMRFEPEETPLVGEKPSDETEL